MEKVTFEQKQTVLIGYEKVNQEVNRLENLQARIKSEWCGYASDAFRNQLSMVIADLKATRESLYRLYTTLNEYN